MSHSSRFLDEDAHFDEVPGCPLKGVRSGQPPSTNESACAPCRYNVAFPKEPTIGCRVLTPLVIVERARSVMGAALVQDLLALRTTQAREGVVDAARWSSLAERLLDIDDDAARELGSVILRFARATSLGPVEILR